MGEVPAAGHVVHWDNPAGWRAVVEPFVREMWRAPPTPECPTAEAPAMGEPAS